MFLFIIFVIFYLHYSQAPYYQPALDKGRIKMQPHDKDTLRIVYLGDSWAERHKSHRCLIGELIGKELNMPVKVMTVGVSGLTSKDVYLGMFEVDTIKSAFITAPDFCFIVAGINDSDRKMGTMYYKENMRLIVKQMLSNQIVPVVLEIPFFNCYRSFKMRKDCVKIRYLRSMVINGEPMNCIFLYRKAFEDLLTEQGWNDSVIYLKSEFWNPLGYKDSRNLYDDGQMHINDKGYNILDSCIAKSILNYLNNLN